LRARAVADVKTLLYVVMGVVTLCGLFDTSLAVMAMLTMRMY